MALDVSGVLLEGIRAGRGDNPVTMAPRTIVSDDSALQSVSIRAEYAILAWSEDSAKTELEIADPDLRFRWTRNRGPVSRFDYDSFSQRWTPQPGGPPDLLGPLSNEERVISPVPDLSQADAPFALYVGSPIRRITFSIQEVDDQSEFSSPASLASGTVQLSRADGALNFSSSDVSLYSGQAVLCQRQSFFSRVKSTGSIGSLPASSGVAYFLFLNPRPAVGQIPLIRIGYGRHLTAIQVADESALGSPASGSFTWSLDTGRIRLSDTDVSSGAGTSVYYDGVVNGTIQLQRSSVGPVSGAFPSPAFTVPALIGLADESRFVFFAEMADRARRYLQVSLSNGMPSRPPSSGVLVVDVLTGSSYLSVLDAARLSGWEVGYVDSVGAVESGVSVQFFRSAINGSGISRVADFRVGYEISDQVVASGLGASPFVILPTIPLVDESLEFQIVRGPGSAGTYVGPLADGSLPSSTGLGYVLDLDAKQVSFSSRRDYQTTLRIPSSAIKLQDAAINERSLTVLRDGLPIVPGVDFQFDSATGLVQFLDPVGESDPATVDGLTGTAILPNIFRADSRIFTGSDVGSWLFVQSGPAIGVYKIRSLSETNPLEAVMEEPFPAAGYSVTSLRKSADVLADRFWRPMRPPYRKFSLTRQAPGGDPVSVSEDKMDIFVNVGQVNLAEPALPGEIFTVAYVSLESQDGVSITPVNRVERALFKVRQEAASYVAGSRTASFNPDGNTVGLARPMSVYVNGVVLSASDYVFESPGTLRFPDPIQSGASIFVDYWVEQSPGGNVGFDLLFAGVDLDFPKIVSGQTTAIFNGDQTSYLAAGSALLIGTSEVLVVAASSYSSVTDTTSVTFTTAPTLTTGPEVDLSTSAPLIMESESSAASILPEGASNLVLAGDRANIYRSGTVVTIGSDPYLVTSSRFEAGQTFVSLAVPAVRNYVLSQVRKSATPVLHPTTSLQTSRLLDAASPFTFVRMGAVNRILEQNADYSVADGGIVRLASPIGFGESVVAFYVAKSIQPVGTRFDFGYSHAVAPSQLNGMEGQRLIASYKLVSPDSFFYRVETFESFLPEVSDSLQQSAQTSGVSGPNTADASSPANKDFGAPGLYFDEQHALNLDLVASRLLKFFNDVVNLYEDVLSGMDGRVVGGRSGRFRFDGLPSNPRRLAYADVTNDVDDEIKIYDGVRLDSFFVFSSGPVYALMADPSPLSRLFPTRIVKTVAINGLTSVADFGQVMGSLEISNVKSVEIMRTTKANAFFSGGPGAVLIIQENGDPDLLIPPFSAGQDIIVYSEDGSPEVQAQVVSVSGAGPYLVTLSVATALRSGSILQDVSDPANAANRSYLPSKDLSVEPDSGQIVNITFNPGGFQEQVVGNELLDAPTTFALTQSQPKRIPALDGSELDDDGRVPAPRLRARSEMAAIQDELLALAKIGFATVGITSQITSTIPLSAGQVVRFLDGPNAGLTTTVAGNLGPGLYEVFPDLPATDPSGSSFSADGSVGPIEDILAEEVGFLATNVPAIPTPPSLVGQSLAQLPALESALRLSCVVLASGTGSVSGTVLTDGSSQFLAAGVLPGCLLLISAGSNRGVYLVSAATDTSVSVDPASPYSPFPGSGSVSYEVMLPEPFLEADQFGSLATAYSSAVAFLAQTLAWAAAPNEPGKVARAAQLNARLAQMAISAGAVSEILEGLGLYDQRYLWIDQRTNRESGSLTLGRRAEAKRAEDLRKMREAQLKTLVAQSL